MQKKLFPHGHRALSDSEEKCFVVAAVVFSSQTFYPQSTVTILVSVQTVADNVDLPSRLIVADTKMPNQFQLC